MDFHGIKLSQRRGSCDSFDVWYFKIFMASQEAYNYKFLIIFSADALKIFFSGVFFLLKYFNTYQSYCLNICRRSRRMIEYEQKHPT